MKRPLARSVLITLLAAVAAFDISEAVLVQMGICAPPAEYGGTLFMHATAPMLLLGIVVGGSALLAATTVLMRYGRGVFLAGVAGLITIAWEIAHDVLAQQFSAVFVAIGLAVIALAEYLWTTEARPEQLRAVEHKIMRIALLVMEGFILVGAVDGGLALQRGAFDQVVSVAWLAGTPFSNYAIPSLVLVIVVGGSALLAATTVFIHREWAVLASVAAGLVMVGFLVVEAVSIDGKVGDVLPTVIGMQLLYLVPGLVILGLAGSLWMREYGDRHIHLSRAWRVGLPGERAVATR